MGQALWWLCSGGAVLRQRGALATPDEWVPEQVQTLEQMRQVAAGLIRLRTGPALDEAGRYRCIERVLERSRYRWLGRNERGIVLRYLQLLSGYSRAQVTRLVARWAAVGELAKRHGAPVRPFVRRYGPEDLALLAEVDQLLGRLPGLVTVALLRRARDVYADARFSRLGSISVAHLYELRQSRECAACERRPVSLCQGVVQPVGVRRAALADDRPGHLQLHGVSSALLGLQDVLCLRALDDATQWQGVFTCRSEHELDTAWACLHAAFPFAVLSVRPAVGAPAWAGRMAQRLQAWLQGGPAVACKPLSPDAPHERFLSRHFNPFLNGHLPCRSAGAVPERGLQAGRREQVMTPLDRLAGRADGAQHLRPGVSLLPLLAQARGCSDLQAARAMLSAHAQLLATAAVPQACR